MRATRRVLTLYIATCLIALVALVALWHSLGRSVELPEVTATGERLQCASYSPFDKDQSPFDQPFVLRPERMDADLALLATRFRCVRTYSVTGLEQVPELARKHGLKLMLGAWVSRDPQQTRQEIEGLVAAANDNPDVVEAVIVGNEALLRKEVTGAQLVELIEEVSARVPMAVTYADVWEFWLKHPEVAPAVDFLTIHLLPYWEDQPAGIEHALHEVEQVRRAFGSAFAPKDILIGETGWPSEGRQRETAVPSRVNQARFMREFIQLAEANGWRYNLIEAFDQPWKRASEGAVGGYWGLYDADREDKGILAGPASNLPHWPWWLAGSATLWLLALAVGGFPNRGRDALLLPLLSALGAACILLWSEQALVTSRYAGEWLWAGLLLGLNLLVLAQATLAYGGREGWRARLLGWLDARSGWWLLAAGFAGAVLTLGLVFDARYRSFPSAALLLPALLFCLRPQPGPRRELSLLAALIAAGIAPQLYQEGLDNLQALGWAATSVVLVLALWRSLRMTHSAASARAG